MLYVCMFDYSLMRVCLMCVHSCDVCIDVQVLVMCLWTIYHIGRTDNEIFPCVLYSSNFGLVVKPLKVDQLKHNILLGK